MNTADKLTDEELKQCYIDIKKRFKQATSEYVNIKAIYNDIEKEVMNRCNIDKYTEKDTGKDTNNT
jgi:hypothetical protein